MGQAEIYNLLKKSKKPLTAKDIMAKLDLGHSSVNHALQKLSQQGEIVSRNMKKFQWEYKVWEVI